MVPPHTRTDNTLSLKRLGSVRVRQSEERERVRRGGCRGGNAVQGDVWRGVGRWEGVGELVVLVATDEVGLSRGSGGVGGWNGGRTRFLTVQERVSGREEREGGHTVDHDGVAARVRGEDALELDWE